MGASTARASKQKSCVLRCLRRRMPLHSQFGMVLATSSPTDSRPALVGPTVSQGGIQMKNKGPVDFFLGVFLEFGAAFCLLFFLPHVPWHWLPAETSIAGANSSLSPFAGVTATERRVVLRPNQPTLSRNRISPTVSSELRAPALLQTEPEPIPVATPSAPLAANIPSHPPPDFRRAFPRQYRS